MHIFIFFVVLTNKDDNFSSERGSPGSILNGVGIGRPPPAGLTGWGRGRGRGLFFPVGLHVSRVARQARGDRIVSGSPPPPPCQRPCRRALAQGGCPCLCFCHCLATAKDRGSTVTTTMAVTADPRVKLLGTLSHHLKPLASPHRLVPTEAAAFVCPH